MDEATAITTLTTQVTLWGGYMLAIITAVLGATFLFVAVKRGIKRLYGMFVK